MARCRPAMAALVLLGLTCLHQLEAAEQQQPQSIEKRPRVERLLVVAATRRLHSEAFERFNRSVNAFELELDVLMPAPGSQVDESVRLEQLKRALAGHKREQHLLIMLVLDSERTIVNGLKQDIVKVYETSFKPASKIVIGAQPACWPQVTDAGLYPSAPGVARFPNGAAIIGLAPDLYALLDFDSTTEISPSVSSSGDIRQEPLIASVQKHLSRSYLDTEARAKLGLELDHGSRLFQTVHWSEAPGEPTSAPVELELSETGAHLRNPSLSSNPLVVLAGAGSANGQQNVVLNSLGNYLAGAWTQADGCTWCNSVSSSLANVQDTELPTVLIGIFVEIPTPFLDSFFESLGSIRYARSQIHLFLHNGVDYHNKQVQQFLDSARSMGYASVEQWSPEVTSSATGSNQSASDKSLLEAQARAASVERCRVVNCDYYFALDAVARLELADTLRSLIEANRTIVAPALSRAGKLWSSFWATLSPDGYYARSHDYVQLVSRERQGLWNVAHIAYAYLMRGEALARHLSDGEASFRDPSDPDAKPALAMSRKLRAANVFMHMLNTQPFGHLVDPSNYDITQVHPDFGQLENNAYEWEREYLHPNYSLAAEGAPTIDTSDDEEDVDNHYGLADKVSNFEILKDSVRYNTTTGADKHNQGDNNKRHLDQEVDANSTTTSSSIQPATSKDPTEEPCPDVFWFPLVNDKFCTQLIEIMENYGQWSGGTSDDPRIEGGYESVPTRDIHMKQVALEQMWLTFLKHYVMPIQLKRYIGYEHDPPRADLAFVVRYHPAEQPALRPHHDSSTYTLNIALNTPGQDYEGGGCRFVRYNCSVTESRRGWALLHPGKLTHYHEGLPVTRGTRYIMVTFVDP